MFKISVIVPSLNTAKFIDTCLSSLVNQTLKDIEIICVDANSNDGTLDIIKKYKNQHSNIKLIISDKKSYGYQMNLGIKNASAEYIGVVEPDDYAEKNMFETLYNIAVSKKCDVVKAQYKAFNTNSGITHYSSFIPSFLLERKIKPLDCSRKPFIISYTFNIPSSIWSAIYNKQMLIKNDIFFNETSGASFQDTSFLFKVFLCCDSVYFIDDRLINYRLDNPSSSVNDLNTKDFCIVNEIEEIQKFIIKKNFFQKKYVKQIFGHFKYSKYKWNCNRLKSNNNKSFFDYFQSEMKKDYKNGYLKSKYFFNFEWNDLLHLINKDNNIKIRILNNRYYSIFRSICRAGIKFVIWQRKRNKK